MKTIFKGLKSKKPFLQIIRFRVVWKYSKARTLSALHWVKLRTPLSNHYYDLDHFNLEEITYFLSQNFRISIEVVNEYLAEILDIKKIDSEIREQLPAGVRYGFGRRIVWYAAIRILKPKVVVETGVHQGMGSYVVCRALEMNESEGFEGHAFGTEINPNCGQLIPTRLRRFSTILIGDSLESLEDLDVKVDIFVNDSNHDITYEYNEYLAIQNKLSKQNLIIGDNSHASNSLRKYCHEQERDFYFLPERPLNHWYLGAGVGFSLAK